MTVPTQQAGLMFAAWFSSCLSCLWSQEDHRQSGSHRQATGSRGEMPLKLLLRDGLADQ